MLTNTFIKWMNKFTKRYFTYENGFIHLPYKGNNPELMLDSFKNLPFVKHDKKRQSIYTNTPFMEGGFYYRELEEGCYFFCSNAKYKMNVCFDVVKEENYFNNYFGLSLNLIEPKAILYEGLSDKRITFPKFSWSLQTPSDQGTLHYLNLNFSGTVRRSLSLYFTEAWFYKNIAKNKLYSQSKLERFIEAGEGFLFAPFDDKEYVMDAFDNIEQLFLADSEEEQRGTNSLSLKLHSLTMVLDFLKHCNVADIVVKGYAVDEEDVILKAEKYLVEHLFDKFPGVEFLAKKLEVSESKLKIGFKNYFGKPMYQYFRDRQMELAKELIINNQMIIKEVSYKLGYENQSKFSAAFKSFHGVLPSEL